MTTSSRVARLMRTARTVRNLRLSQVAWRLIRTGQRRFEQPSKPSTGNGLSLNLEAARRHLDRLPIDESAERPAAIDSDGELRLLGQPWPLFDARTGTIEWRLGPVRSGRLQTITLHYHDWFEPLAKAAAGGDTEAATMLRRMWADWLARCPLDADGSRDLAWNAYAIATRVIAWFRCLATLPDSFWTDELPRQQVVASLFDQGRFLVRHVEWDVRGNHLLRDGVGLLWLASGLAATDRDAMREIAKWQRLGERIVEAEVPHQQFGDGLHYERSLHYHFEFLRDLLAIHATWPQPFVSDALALGVEEPETLRHPDGRSCHFGDGQAEWPADVLAAAASVSGASPSGTYCRTEFALSRFQAVYVARWALFQTFGPPGPREQPGHAHDDCTAIELSLDDRRLIVDPGTYDYDDGPRRRHDRSAAAHNAVCYDGQNRNEFWHIFRLGRRAPAASIEGGWPFTSDGGSWTANRRTPHAGQRDARTITIDTASVSIVDRIVTAGGATSAAVSFLIPAPWVVDRDHEASNRWIASCEDAAVAITFRGPSTLQTDASDASHAPRYLVDEPATRMRWRLPLHDITTPIEVAVRFEIVLR